jgi:hypothetical protein
MGGKNEATVPKVPAASTTPRPDTTLTDKVRMHESNGEVHLHDDKHQIKVAIPAVTYWDKWNRFKQNPRGGPVRFEDGVNNSCAIITAITVHGASGDKLDARIDIEEFSQVPLPFTGAMAALDRVASTKA